MNYANDLVTRVGEIKAMSIAKRCMNASSPSQWNSLPIGNIFYKERDVHTTKDELKTLRTVKYATGSTSYVLRVKELEKTFRFWQNVYGTLAKRFPYLK